MKKEKKEKLKGVLINMAGIAKYACNLYSRDLHFPNQEIERTNGVFIDSPDIDFLKYIIRNTLILELTKLFGKSNSDKFSFQTLVRKFQIGGEFCNPKLHSFSSELYDSFTANNKTILEDFYKLRNEVIAHTDFCDTETKNSLWDFLIYFNSFTSFAIDFISAIFKEVFGEVIPVDFKCHFYSRTNFELLTVFKNHKRGIF